MENSPENLALLKKFVVYVVEQLQIKSNANIELLFEHNPQYPSAGGYVPSDKKVMCAVKNRAIADIMRTIAHELTHHKQNELGMIGPDSTDDQKLEDQANIWSGKLVRLWGRKHREIYADLI